MGIYDDQKPLEKEDIGSLIELLASLEYISGEMNAKVPGFIGKFEHRVEQIDGLKEKLETLTFAVDKKIKDVAKEQNGSVLLPSDKYEEMSNKISLLINYFEETIKQGKRKKSAASVVLERLDDISEQIRESRQDRSSSGNKKFYVPDNNVPKNVVSKTKSEKKTFVEVIKDPLVLISFILGIFAGGAGVLFTAFLF